MRTTRYLALPVLAAWFGLTSISGAQMVKGRQIVRAELLTDANDFSKPFMVGIRFTIEPDWYLYWKNPGDSGLPIGVDWMLPRGWSAEEIKHPVPQKFAHDNVVSYGYKREVVLIATINPAGSEPPILMAKLDWLVCEESCIRGSAEVRLDLRSVRADKDGRAREILDQYRERLPLPRRVTPVVFRMAKADMTGPDLNIQIPFDMPSSVEVVDFYPESVKGILIDFSSVRVEGKTVIFNGTLEGTGTGEIFLRGLLIGADGKGYECSVPVQFTTKE